MEETTPQLQETNSDKTKRWFQDNLRIIVSVIIVLLIAGGIYSYSKRTDDSSLIVQNENKEDVDANENNENGTVEISAEQDQKNDTQQNKQQDTQVKTTGEKVTSIATSKETETSFIEAAAKGDGLTNLARKATSDYLEKNPDSELTKEHKIYIEDYLRKNVGHKGGVSIGTSVEFSKELIKKAIEQSKKLNERQLKNLQKYSARVTSLQ